MKIVNKLFLAIIFSIPLYASGFEDLTAIYTYGDVDFIKFVIMAVSKGVATDTYENFLIATTFLAVVSIGIKVSKEPNMEALFKHAYFPFIVIGLLNTTVTVHIEDQRVMNGYSVEAGRPTYAVVDNVPTILAVMYGTSSIFQYVGIELVNEALVNIDPSSVQYGTSKVGFAREMTTLLEITDIATKSNFFDKTANTRQFAKDLQSYLYTCVIKAGMNKDPNIYDKIRNPHTDIIDVIEADKIGLDDYDKIDDINGDAIKCQVFWSTYLKDPYGDVSTKLTDSLTRKTGTSLSETYAALNKVGGLDTNSTILGNEFGSIKGYGVNAGSIAIINKAISQNEQDIQTNVSYADRITSQNAITQIQMGGIGIGKWFATIAPFAFHILLGVMYFYGLFIPAIAIIMGAEAGSKYILSYFGGLIGMAAVGIGMALASDIMSYFTSLHMVELVSTLGGNPATVNSLPQYYQDLATYTGVTGTLGMLIALVAPSIILKGQSSALISGMGSFSGMYKGGVESAEDTLANQDAKQKAYEAEKNDIAKRKLENAGFSLSDIPTNMSAGDYYQKVTDSANKAGSAWGAFNGGLSNDGGFDGMTTESAQSSMYQQSQKMGQASEFAQSLNGANGSGSQMAFNSGRIQGAIQASSIEADDASIESLKAIHDGAFKQARKKLGSTAGYGASDISGDEAFNSGQFEGSMSAAGDKVTGSVDSDIAKSLATTLGADKAMKSLNSARGLQESGAFNSDGTFDENSGEYKKYMQGQKNESRIAANKTMGVGKLGELSADDMANVQRNSKAGALGEFAKGQVLKEKYGADLEKDTDVMDKKGKKLGTAHGYRDVAHANASMMEDKSIGGAAAYNSGKINDEMLQKNAAYGTLSQALTTAAKIDTQGGVSSAVATDVGDATKKATIQQKALSGELEQHLMSKDGGSKSKEEAQKMVDAFLRGGDGAAEKMKQAFNSMGNLAFAQSGAKTGSDLTAVSAHGTAKKFIEDKKGATLSKEAVEAVSAESFKNKKVMDGKVHAMVRKAYDDAQGGEAGQKAANKKLKQLKDLGIATQDSKIGANGDVSDTHSTLGNNARKAYALASAGVMESDERMMIGGEKTNLATNNLTGETRIKVDGSDTSTYGNTVKIGTTDVDSKVAITKAGGIAGAQQRKEGKEAAKTAMDPKEWVSNIAEVLGNALGSEEAGVVAASVIAGGGAAALYNQKTKGDVKLSKKQIKENGLKAMVDEETGKTTGYSKNGVRVADSSGNLVDSHGDKVQRGSISKKVIDSWNKMADLKNSFSTDKTTNTSTNNQNPDHSQSTDGDIDKKTQGTPPNSDTNSVPNNSKTSKTGGKIIKGAGAVGTIAAVGDAIARGNVDEIIDTVEDFTSRITNGNIFGNTKDGNSGASTMLENLIIGDNARTKAFSNFEKGNYVAGFGDIAQGFGTQMIDGVSTFANISTAAAKSLYDGSSYTENMNNPLIPTTQPQVAPQHIQQAFTTAPMANTVQVMDNATTMTSSSGGMSASDINGTTTINKSASDTEAAIAANNSILDTSTHLDELKDIFSDFVYGDKGDNDPKPNS